MAQTVWKEILKPIEVQQIMIPAGAELICAREQFENICVWFKCDPGAAKEPRTLAIVGTGHAAPIDDGRYIGTASLHGGQLMFHVFERVERC